MFGHVWKTTVNAALRRMTGYQLQKPTPSPPGRRSAPDDRHQRDLDREIHKLRTQLDVANAEARRIRRHAIFPDPRLAEITLARLGEMPTEKMTLTDIANLHGTDKGTLGPSAGWAAHNYTDVYEAYLSPLRFKRLHLLEVGLGVPGHAWEARIAHGRNEGGGASMRMWHDYFPNGQIYGADINPAQHLDSERTKTFVVDQGDPDSLESFLDSVGDISFDVIVDDGSHRPDHQQVTLSCLFPRLKPGGLYIVEDLLTNGKGDLVTGRMSSETVLNTRRVLKGFQLDGTFEAPNALLDEPYLSRHIEQMNFHVLGPRLRPNTERVCVIRKTR
jgi:hypothetical protein